MSLARNAAAGPGAVRLAKRKIGWRYRAASYMESFLRVGGKSMFGLLGKFGNAWPLAAMTKVIVSGAHRLNW